MSPHASQLFERRTPATPVGRQHPALMVDTPIWSAVTLNLSEGGMFVVLDDAKRFAQANESAAAPSQEGETQ